MNKYLLFVSYGSITEKHIKIVLSNFSKYKIILYRSGKGRKKIDKNFYTIINSLKQTLDYKYEAVFICSPAVNHIKEIIFFSKFNKKIFVEKPLTNLKLNNKIINFLNTKKLIFQIGYVLKFEESLIYFRKLIKKNFVGKILKVNINASSYLPNWRKTEYTKSVSAKHELGGGALLELSHEIDYIIWIFDNIKSVFASYTYSKTLKINTEDNVDIILQTFENYNITVNLNFNQKKENRMCEVFGTNGYIKIDVQNKNILMQKYKNKKLSKIIFKKDKNLMYINQLQYFLNLRKKLNNNINSFQSAIKTQNLLDKIIVSNKLKKVINL